MKPLVILTLECPSIFMRLSLTVPRETIERSFAGFQKALRLAGA